MLMRAARRHSPAQSWRLGPAAHRRRHLLGVAIPPRHQRRLSVVAAKAGSRLRRRYHQPRVAAPPDQHQLVGYGRMNRMGWPPRPVARPRPRTAAASARWTKLPRAGQAPSPHLHHGSTNVKTGPACKMVAVALMPLAPMSREVRRPSRRLPNTVPSGLLPPSSELPYHPHDRDLVWVVPAPALQWDCRPPLPLLPRPWHRLTPRLPPRHLRRRLIGVRPQRQQRQRRLRPRMAALRAVRTLLRQLGTPPHPELAAALPHDVHLEQNQRCLLRRRCMLRMVLQRRWHECRRRLPPLRPRLLPLRRQPIHPRLGEAVVPGLLVRPRQRQLLLLLRLPPPPRRHQPRLR